MKYWEKINKLYEKMLDDRNAHDVNASAVQDGRGHRDFNPYTEKK